MYSVKSVKYIKRYAKMFLHTICDRWDNSFLYNIHMLFQLCAFQFNPGSIGFVVRCKSNTLIITVLYPFSSCKQS